ncbi:MAG: two pore domain potassium channel family protein [Chloroflexia bacterium]|nr:two pore domain potassium channel family protein [Chloroflexia bacterium]
MTLLLTLVGVGVMALVIRDIFQTLFAPSGSGRLSQGAARQVWRLVRSVSSRKQDRLSVAGPLSLVLIILLWTGGLILAWACLLWPHLPERFLLSPGMDPEQNDGFLNAVYVSLVTLGTLGYGEITPEPTWLRLLVPLEALIGFALFTASISWIMSIYPGLARRRHLAREVSILHRSEQRSGVAIADLDAGMYCTMLRDLASQVIAVRNDFIQFPITYYFRTSDRAASLEVALPPLVALARNADRHDSPAVRLNAALLLEALLDLSSHLAETWVDCDDEADMDGVLEAYAADHMHSIGDPV